MSLFREIVETAPITNTLEFGYNHNLVIKNVDIGQRLRKGIPVSQNTFITYSKVNPETREVLAETELSYWNLKPGKWAEDNFIDQYNSLLAVVKAVGADAEKFMDSIDSELDTENIDKLVKDKKSCTEAQETLSKIFYDSVKDHVGLQSTLLKGKFVMNESGFFVTLSSPNWICKDVDTETLDKITQWEVTTRDKAIAAKAKAPTSAKPDNAGKLPGTKNKPTLNDLI